MIKNSFCLSLFPSFPLSFPLSFSFFPVLEKCGKVANICQPISFSFGAVLVSYVLSAWHPLMLSSHYKSTQQEKMSFFVFSPFDTDLHTDLPAKHFLVLYCVKKYWLYFEFPEPNRNHFPSPNPRSGQLSLLKATFFFFFLTKEKAEE